MNETIKNHVARFNLAQGWDVTDESIVETIREAPEVWSGHDKPRRWWTDCLTVVSVDGMLIGFNDAKTTGDSSASDVGWEFDSSSICEVEEKTVQVTVYQRKA